MLPVWSRTEPLSWASAALTCAYAALQERKRTRANMTNAKPRFIFPPAGKSGAYERSFELVAEETRNRTIRGHSSLSGPLSYNENKCQELNFYIKVICFVRRGDSQRGEVAEKCPG